MVGASPDDDRATGGGHFRGIGIGNGNGIEIEVESSDAGVVHRSWPQLGTR